MSKIEELIEKLCPDGVEYKSISKISDNVFSGGTPSSSKEEYYNGDIPWLRSGEINFNKIDSTEKTITQLGLNSSSAKWIKAKSVVIALTGATVARSGYTEIRLASNQSVCAIEVSNNMNYKFLYYWLSNMYKEIKNKAQGALTSINLQFIKNIEVPVPPMEIQREIVQVLDNFTQITAELTAELTARRKQYEFYRDKLLTFEEPKIEWLKLCECCKIFAGGDIPKDRYSKESTEIYKVPIFSNGIGENALYGYTDKPKITNKCVTI